MCEKKLQREFGNKKVAYKPQRGDIFVAQRFKSSKVPAGRHLDSARCRPAGACRWVVIGLQRYSPAGASLFNPLIYNI
ncbi:MAG: hypothetical protein EAZ95_00690, partial [Bacteroidetes bacterium]